MMKKILGLIGFAGLVFAASTAQSQAARYTIGMTANVGGVCSVSAPTANNGFGTATATGAPLVVSAPSGIVTAKLATMTLPYSCTSTNVQLQLTSANQGITKTGGTSKIHYSAKFFINSGAVLATLNTATAAATAAIVDPTPAGNLNLEVTVPAGTAAIAPGDYTDNLWVDVLPNP